MGVGSNSCLGGLAVFLQPLLTSYREGVDENPDEEQQDEDHDGDEKDPLEAPPQDVLHGFVGGGEPQEGGFRAPATRTVRVSCELAARDGPLSL